MSVWGDLRSSLRATAAALSAVVVMTIGVTAPAGAEPVPEPTATTTSPPTSEPTTPATPVDVTAQTDGSRPVGAATEIWGIATGAPHAYVTIQIIVGGAWANTAYGTTDAEGAYRLPVTYGTNTPGTYTLRTLVTADGTTSTSPSVTLTRVSRTVTATTDGSRPVGSATDIWGTAPHAPNSKVTVQVIVSGAWANTAYGTTDAAGAYRIPVTYGTNTPGTYTLRTLVTADGTTSISPSVTLTRVSRTVTATTDGSRTVSTPTSIWGTAPHAPNTRVTVQVIVGGAWANTAYGTTDAAGAYRIPVTYGSTTPGTYTLRALVSVQGTTYASRSVTLTRTRLDPRCYTSGVVICASKKDRKVYYVNRGTIVRTLDARFGGRAYDVNGRERMYTTAEGTFSVTRKIRNEVSYIYGNTPMPFSVYFYGGQAFHYSYGFARDGWVGDWGSHGCINLRSWSGAEWLFNNTRVGTKVVVYR
jgi:hypothetical protein